MTSFAYATKLAAYICNHTFKTWQGNLNKRDIRNYYVSLLMKMEENEAREFAGDVVGLCMVQFVKMPTTRAAKKIVLKPSYDSMLRYKSLEAWQEAQTRGKQLKVSYNRRALKASPRNTTFERTF